MATKEDKKLIEGWKAEAEGIFIFVCYYLLQVLPTLHLIGIDGSILRCCCVVDYSFHSGTSTESTGHLELLPCQYLSSYNQRRCTRHLEFPPYFPSPILSTRICSLGQCSLALEPGHQSYVCSARKFLQQWARRYLEVTQPHYGPRKRAVGSVCSLLKVSRIVSFHGCLTYCPCFSTFPYSYSSLALSCYCRTSILPFSS